MAFILKLLIKSRRSFRKPFQIPYFLEQEPSVFTQFRSLKMPFILCPALIRGNAVTNILADFQYQRFFLFKIVLL